MLGAEFSMKNKMIKNELILHCRHLYELIIGACSFVEHCQHFGLASSHFTESTIAYKTDNKLVCIDRASLNCEESVIKIDFSSLASKVQYDSLGSVKSVEDSSIQGYSFSDGYWRQINYPHILSAQNNREYVYRLMKAITEYWFFASRQLGIHGGFYFSHIWPPTFYGILSQSLAIAIFGKNYLYFQHCINGIQRKNNVPLCVGVIRDMNEGEKYFGDLKFEDLY